jgi:hypothetical protein
MILKLKLVISFSVRSWPACLWQCRAGWRPWRDLSPTVPRCSARRWSAAPTEWQPKIQVYSQCPRAKSLGCSVPWTIRPLDDASRHVPRCSPGSGHIGQGRVGQLKHRPRDTLSKRQNIRDFSFGDTLSRQVSLTVVGKRRLLVHSEFFVAHCRCSFSMYLACLFLVCFLILLFQHAVYSAKISACFVFPHILYLCVFPHSRSFICYPLYFQKLTPTASSLYSPPSLHCLSFFILCYPQSVLYFSSFLFPLIKPNLPTEMSGFFGKKDWLFQWK